MCQEIEAHQYKNINTLLTLFTESKSWNDENHTVRVSLTFSRTTENSAEETANVLDSEPCILRAEIEIT